MRQRVIFLASQVKLAMCPGEPSFGVTSVTSCVTVACC